MRSSMLVGRSTASAIIASGMLEFAQLGLAFGASREMLAQRRHLVGIEPIESGERQQRFEFVVRHGVIAAASACRAT